jgi:hypothetical protein
MLQRVVVQRKTASATLHPRAIGFSVTSVVIVGPTVTSAKPETPPAIAVILAEPAATPVTTPALFTVAMDWLEEDH